MHRTSKWMSLFIIALIILSLGGTAAAQSSEAQARFVHALPGAGPIDIYVDGLPAVRGLGFGEASTYVLLPAADNQLVVTQAGATTPLWQQAYTPTVGGSFTLVVSSTNPLQFTSFPDDITPLPLGRTRITAIHAIEGAPAVDIVLEDGRAVVAGLTYNQPYGTLDIPALTYPLAVVPSGGAVSEALLPVTPFALNSGTSYTVVALGTPANPQALVLSAPTTPETEGGFVRLVHGVPEAPEVDVYLDDVLIAPSLAYGQSTSFLAAPAADYGVSVRAAGETDVLLSGDLTVTVGEYVTAAVVASGDDLVLNAFVDDVAALDAQSTGFAVLNGADDEVTVTLQGSDGSDLGEGLAAESGEGATTILQPSATGLTAAAAAGDAEASAPLAAAASYGGVYYSALAVNTEDGIEILPLAPVSFSQAPGSAPGTTLAAAAPVEPTAVAAVPTATLAPTLEPAVVAQAPTQPPIATPDPMVVQPTAPVTAPQPTPTSAGPTARVVLDPGANLQLRQYPNRDAFSLGLAPSGSVLQVIGRAGDPAPLPGVATPTVDPLVTPTVDPVSLIPETEDLAPADTWLNVVYTTPDGGEIEAWVNAQFLDVRSDRGERQRLAELPTVPSNRPGEARNTAVTPPPLPENIVLAVVFNLDAGSNLQIRRTPSSAGESLALVPNDTALELVGLNEARDWAFVRYTPAEGGVVNGWVSTSFIQYEYRGGTVDLEELEARGLLTTVPDTQRGSLGTGVAAPAAPTRDPLRDVIVATIQLNTGANLHLRRNPDANSESLALMPSGTQVAVSGRTDTSEWVQIEFEGQLGWTSTQYLTFSFNGAAYNLQDVPIILSTSTIVDPALITPTPGA